MKILGNQVELPWHSWLILDTSIGKHKQDHSESSKQKEIINIKTEINEIGIKIIKNIETESCPF